MSLDVVDTKLQMLVSTIYKGLPLCQQSEVKGTLS